MNLHSLKTKPGSRRRRMRVGRGVGSGKGKTCGRGHKGQMARTGHKHKPGFEGGQMRLVRRVPKVGYTNPTRREYAVVNVEGLDRFAEGTEVTPDLLRSAGLVRKADGGIKILGQGELKKRLTVKAAAFSAGAKTKIEAAGGVCEVIGR